MMNLRSKKRRCPHSRLRGIYGDEINHCGGYRLECLQCGGLVDGPVALAIYREGEWKSVTNTQ